MEMWVVEVRKNGRSEFKCFGYAQAEAQRFASAAKRDGATVFIWDMFGAR